MRKGLRYKTRPIRACMSGEIIHQRHEMACFSAIFVHFFMDNVTIKDVSLLKNIKQFELLLNCLILNSKL